MKNLFILSLAVSGMALCSFVAADVFYKVDTKASNVHWVGKKTSGQHEGDVAIKSGSLKLSNNVPVGGEFILDMNSITCTDIKDPDDNKSLVDHLKEDDFFGTANHPTAALNIKSFAKIDKAEAGKPNYNVTADLIIKGIKNEIRFPALVEVKADVVNASAAFTIDRTKWNISYKSRTVLGAMADKFIYDDVNFSVKLVLKK